MKQEHLNTFSKTPVCVIFGERISVTQLIWVHISANVYVCVCVCVRMYVVSRFRNVISHTQFPWSSV